MKGSYGSSSTAKKQEDNTKILENIRKLGTNKECFDCGEKGTTYLVMQYGIFVCSKCAGIHRELNIKVKGIGVCNFDDKEIAFLNKMGNDKARAIWMANFKQGKHKLPDPKDSNAIRNHLKEKYQDKKWYKKESNDDSDQEDQNKNSKNKKPANDSSDESSDDAKYETKPKKDSNNKKPNQPLTPINDKKNLVINTSNIPAKLNPINIKNSSATPSNLNFNIRKPGENNMTNNNNLIGNPNSANVNFNSNVGANSGFTFFDTEPTNKPNNNISNNANSQFNFTAQSQAVNNNNPNKSNANNSSWPNTWGGSNNSNIQNPNNNPMGDFIFVNDNPEPENGNPNIQKMSSNTINMQNTNPINNSNSNNNNIYSFSNQNSVEMNNLNQTQNRVSENIHMNNVNNFNNNTNNNSNDLKDIFSFVNNPAPINNMNPNFNQNNQINANNNANNLIDSLQQTDPNQENNQRKKKMDDLDSLLRDPSMLSNNPMQMPNYGHSTGMPNQSNYGNLGNMGQPSNQQNHMMMNFFNQMAMSNPNLNQQQMMQMFNMFMQNMQMQQGASMHYQNVNQQQMNNPMMNMMVNSNLNQTHSIGNLQQNNHFNGSQGNPEVNKPQEEQTQDLFGDIYAYSAQKQSNNIRNSAPLNYNQNINLNAQPMNNMNPAMNFMDNNAYKNNGNLNQQQNNYNPFNF